MHVIARDALRLIITTVSMKLCCYSKFWWSVAGVITVALVLIGAAVRRAGVYKVV